MSFSGSSVKTPIMAAAHGMRQVAFNTIGDKVIRPLVEFAPPEVTQFAAGAAQQAMQTAAGAAGAVSSAAAGATSAAAGSSGSSPISALPELTGTTPTVPVDFRDMPQVDSASILDRARNKVRGVLSGLPAGVQDAAINAAETAITDGVAKTAGRKLGSDWSERAKTLVGATGLGSGVDSAKKAVDGAKKAADAAVGALPGSPGAMKDAVGKVVADKAQQELARKAGTGWAKAARTVYDGSAKKPDIADAKTPPFVPDPAKPGKP